jgi:AcrR family transcriptional regulator
MKTLDPILHHNRKNSILDHARHLFATKGFSETSMDDIARTCHLQKASLYHYFDSKQQLLQDLVDRESIKWSDMVIHFEGGRDLKDTLTRIATRIMEDVKDPGRREFFQIVQFESHNNPCIWKALKASPTHNRAGFYAVFAKHLDGRLPRNRIAIFITQFMGALLHYIRIAKLHSENMCYEPIEDQDYIAQLVLTFSAGIHPQLQEIPAK